MSGSAKVMSTGVHNIAFLHTPDVNYHFDLVMRLLFAQRRIAPSIVRILTTVIGKHTGSNVVTAIDKGLTYLLRSNTPPCLVQLIKARLSKQQEPHERWG